MAATAFPSHSRFGYLLAGALGLLVGYAVYLDDRAGFAVTAVLLGALALSLPTAVWVGGAVALAIGGRALVSYGPLPESSVQLPIVLAWVALVMATVRHRPGIGSGTGLLVRLAGLIVAVVAAGVVAGAEPLRGLFYLSLLGTPFALLGALLLDPPDPKWHRRLIVLMVGLLAVQVPFVVVQAAQSGIGDPVRGTLIGSDVGAHVVGAVCLTGALWAVLGRRITPLNLVAATILAAVPILSGANQVIFAFPLALIAVSLISRQRVGIAAVVVAGSVIALVALPGVNSNYARDSLKRVSQLLKPAPAEEVGRGFVSDPAVALFGQGPATTVSHASFLTYEENPLIGDLGLHPSTIPGDLNANALPGSIERPKSSVLGVLGDLGFVGLLAYGALFFHVFNLARRKISPLGQAVTVGLAMMLIAGYLNDWLEQPPFTLFLTALVGLALTAPEEDPEPDAGTPPA